MIIENILFISLGTALVCSLLAIRSCQKCIKKCDEMLAINESTKDTFRNYMPH